MVTRRIDVFDPAVVTVAHIKAGTTTNVIPETAEILGTIRAVSERTRTQRARRAAAGGRGHRRRPRRRRRRSRSSSAIPSRSTTSGYAGFATAGRQRVCSATSAVTTMRNPVMGAEDFSYVLQRVPGAMAFLGAAPPGVDPATPRPTTPTG